ncbi:DinB family protein [soil metagenome]
MPRPVPGDYGEFFANYIALVPEEEILAAMAVQLDEMLSLLSSVSEAVSLVRHAPYTWSTREVLGHLIDGERIFTYRALRIGRGDKTPLPSFDENTFAVAGTFDRIPLKDLIHEFDSVRRASLSLFRHFPEEAWTNRGIVSGHEIATRALAYITVGHVRHHGAILKKRLAIGIE